MFDIAFSELVVIAVVALIVVGPERLPKVARTIGVVIGRFQKMAQNFKDDLARAAPLNEIQTLRDDFQKTTESITNDLNQQIAENVKNLETLPDDFCGPPQKKGDS